MEPNEAQTAPKWGTGGSSTVPVGPSEAQINSSTPQVKPNGAQMEPSGVQMELKWGSKSLRSPFQNQLCDHFDCSEAACALRHAIWTEKAPKSALIPEKRVLSIVATKQLDVLRSITFYSRKTVFCIVGQRRSRVQLATCDIKKYL